VLNSKNVLGRKMETIDPVGATIGRAKEKWKNGRSKETATLPEVSLAMRRPAPGGAE
jgi:hypothetical protein